MVRSFLITLIAVCSIDCRAQELPVIQLYDDDRGVFDEDLLPAAFHRERRTALRDLLPSAGVAVFFANPVRNRSNDVDFEYHQDPNFYYLTGHREPHAMLLIFKDSVEVSGAMTDELIVVQARDPLLEIWEGRKTGVEGARSQLGFNHVVSGEAFAQLDLRLGELEHIHQHSAKENLLDDPDRDDDLYGLMAEWDKKLVSAGHSAAPSTKLVDAMSLLREVKTEQEIVLMRKAIDITCEAQNELMRQLSPGMHEYETEAIVEYVFKKNGAEHEGFPSIQGGGPHSCVLHYVSNRRELSDSDLLVSDIGAEYHGYTADVTRTLPASGKFSKEQRAIYELVLKAQQAGINQAKVGADFWAPHKAATQVITEGLMDLGIIKDEADLRRYFMHGTSHYLGLDVHDAGTYGPLKVNSVITVEPGIYIAKDSPCDPKWWDIGVRIEDDILITEQGPENLSAGSPRSVDEVERMMSTNAENEVR